MLFEHQKHYKQVRNQVGCWAEARTNNEISALFLKKI
jgi:hypothetical protein